MNKILPKSLLRKSLILPIIVAAGRLVPVALVVAAVGVNVACTEQREHIAPAVRDEDSVPVMVSYGVNMLISDSGVIKYKIVAEESITNQNLEPKRTIYNKGVFMTQFDEALHVEAYIQADTGYRYDELGLIELRGRVRMLTRNGVRFRGEELFWDQTKHEYYSNQYSWLTTPERDLEGNYFRSNEDLTRYYVSNSKGSFEQRDVVGDDDGARAGDGAERADSDSLYVPIRQRETPRARKL